MRYTNEQRLVFAKQLKWSRPYDVFGENVDIHKTAVIGLDGFGYVREDDGSLFEMPHTGNIVLGSNVRIKALVTIDRAVQGSTAIGDGTKIDHHSHIAHGCKIGKHNTLANGCIIEGSCEIGDFNTFGAGVIVQTKVKVGNNCIIGSGSVVTKDVEDNSVMVGNPARLLRRNE